MLEGIVPDLSRSGCGHSRLYRSVRLFTALHAIEEILDVRNGSVAETSLIEHWILLS